MPGVVTGLFGTRSPHDESSWPPLCGWLDPALVSDLQWRIARRTYRDEGIGEVPKGSNRSGRVDRYLRRAGVPESVIRSGMGYWCAAWAGAVWHDAGAEVPSAYADCDRWVGYARKNGLWVPASEVVTRLKSREGAATLVGGATLYGTPTDASHIGVVTRADPDYFRNTEGNTSSNGYSRNGTLCESKDVSFTRLLGVALPRARAA